MIASTTLDVLGHLLSLDVSWLANFAAGSIIWVFIFAAIAFFIYPNKSLFRSFIVVTILLWASTDFANALGWVLIDPRFFALSSVVQIGVLMFAEADEDLKKHFTLINTLRFLVLLTVFNLFLR